MGGSTLDNSIWLFKGRPDGTYEFKKVTDTGALPADLRQSPDNRYLYVSCFGDKLLQQWDVTDPSAPGSRARWPRASSPI